MLKHVNGQVSWTQTLKEKYDKREQLLNDLRDLQMEIAAFELHMMLQGMPTDVDEPRQLRGE